MSRELEPRNRAMYQMYSTGKSFQDIADTYGVSRQRAAQIIARYVQEGAVTDDESRSLAVAQFEALEQEMLKIAFSDPVPTFDVKGVPLIDDNGQPVLDYKHKMDAADTYRKLSESKRRTIALDLPRRKQVAEDEAMRQVKEYLASLPRATVEETGSP